MIYPIWERNKWVLIPGNIIGIIKHNTITVFLSLFILTIFGCDEKKYPIHAGTAVMNITPPLELNPILGGYGDRMSKPAIGIHDYIYAKAIVFKDHEKLFALVTADMQSFPPFFKSQLVESLQKYGWNDKNILLLPSHSHSSIEMMSLHIKNNLNIPQIGIFNNDVLELTIENFTNVILEAQNNLKPVTMGTIKKKLDGWNRNRRKGNSAVDEDLTITRINRMDKSPLAILINWTAHPTFMGPDDMEFSGGWPGHLQRTVEKLSNSNTTVFYYNGAEGDQSPTPRLHKASNLEQATTYGTDLGTLSWELSKNIQTKPVFNLHYYHIDLHLPSRCWHPEFMDTGGKEYGISSDQANYIINLLFPESSSSTLFNVGDLLIVGIPGEMTAELGKKIKENVHKNTEIEFVTIGGLANEWISYMLSKEEYEKGGYETSVSFYGPTLGPLVVSKIIKASESISSLGIKN